MKNYTWYCHQVIHQVKKKLFTYAVCKFHKSSYGLKQASRLWVLKFFDILTKMGFEKIYGDITLFTHLSDFLWYRFMLMISSLQSIMMNLWRILKLSSSLILSFEIYDICINFLVLNFYKQANRSLWIREIKVYIGIDFRNGLLRLHTFFYKEPKLKLSQDEGELLPKAAKYRIMIGKLMYMLTSRLDLCYAIT